MTREEFRPLLQPGRIGNLLVRNRIVFAAVATKLASETGGLTREYIEFLVARGYGGTGLLVCENTCVEWPRGKGGSTLLRLDQDEMIPRLSRLVDEVHATGAKIAVQLQHVGRQTSLRYSGNQRPLAPSAIRGVGSDVDPEILDLPGIEKMIELFVAASRRAVAAGFDAIELHGAHGYLITQ